MTTTIQQLPAYPTEMEIYIPPPPLAFSDLMGKYNGRLFKGLLPQCIEDKILHMVYEMIKAECLKEWKDIYIRGWSDIWKFNITPDKIQRQVERRNAITCSVSYELNRDVSSWCATRGSGSIVKRWRRHHINNYFHLKDGEGGNDIEWTCWNYFRGQDKKRPNFYTERLNRKSNSQMVININMSASLKFLKAYIKLHYTKEQIRSWFGGLSKYKESNKNVLIKKIYTF
tara:strand:+ start:21 stop:704 length:684 start_codon:yes stop_codon:yes gene_type:complete